MTSRLTILLAIIAALLLPSCSQKQAKIDELACMIDSIRPAFVNAWGDVTDCGLKLDCPSAVVNGYFSVTDGSGISVYKYNGGKPVAVDNLNGLNSAGFYAYGIIPVNRPGHHIELADGEGNTVAMLEIPDGEITECAPFFIEGVLVVTTDKGTKGLVDTRGNIVVNPVYSSIGDIRGGKFIAMLESSSEMEIRQSFAVLDTEGMTVFAFPENVVPLSQDMFEGKVPVRTASGFGICDTNNGGNVAMLPASVKAVTELAGGMLVYRTATGQKGLIGYDCREILAPVYRQIRIGRDGRLAVNDGVNWSLMDADGENSVILDGFMMVSPVTEQAFDAGFAFVGRTEEGYYILDSQGKKMNREPLTKVDYGNLSLSVKISTAYPSATTHMELPLDDGWE